MTSETPSRWPYYPGVPCRRLQKTPDAAEHVRCPYCFGKEGDVQTGEHSSFCDYHPDRDPTSFGFPPESERNLRG